MSTTSIYLEGISLLGPGLDGWQASQAILRGEQAFAPAALQLAAPAALPATERRRAGLAVKLSMAAGLAAVEHAAADAATLPSVFSSTGGDCENCHSILEVLASSERMISPTRFHNSVHNAPAGYWSIATQCQAASTSLCVYDATFAGGLLEGMSQALASGASCLLISFDTAYPEPLYALRPIPYPMGVGMVISPVRTAQSKAVLRLALCQEPAARLVDAQLEALRQCNPTGRSLPLLRQLALAQDGRVVLDYLGDCQLAVEVEHV